MKDIIVVGGGIIGLSSAYYLRASGHRVTVLDKGDFTDNCSFGNAGYVCPSHFIPLATPGIVKQGLIWMLNSRSPFYVQPRLSWPLLNWAWNFMRSATQKKVAEAARPLRDIALLSQREYEAWARIPSFNFSYEHKGLLEIFQTRANEVHARHVVEEANGLGLETELLTRAQLKEMEPQTPINGLGAIYFKCDAHLYPNKLMNVLSDFLRKNGVEFKAHAELTGFEASGATIKKILTPTASFDADEIVLATGSWSREMASLFGAKIPLVPGRGYSVTLENSPFRVNYPAVLTEGRVAITPMDGNKIRFGGTMEITKINTPPRMERVKGILDAVKRFYPEFDIPMPTLENIWYGYRPCSADGLPYIGRIRKFNNVIIATGHSMLGLSLGAGTGKLVSEISNEKVESMDISPFAVERFS
ncbi:MAG: NAD(P)/FAD-dependent oxidoreductase [Chitinophagales bacterium]